MNCDACREPAEWVVYLKRKKAPRSDQPDEVRFILCGEHLQNAIGPGEPKHTSFGHLEARSTSE